MTSIMITLLFLSAVTMVSAADTEADKKNKTDEIIRYLLDQDLGRQTFLFSDVVHATCKKKVLAVDLHDLAHRKIVQAVEKAIRLTQKELNEEDSPIRKLRRINEASRYFEDLLLKKIDHSPHLTCSIPLNNQGKRQRSGYPDLHVVYTADDGIQTHAYLDPKVYEQTSQASSLRTFYFEPRVYSNKIQHDALHLLVGVSHDGKQGQWQFLDWKICDLSAFRVRLKAEFQGSNRDIYRKNIIIRSSE